MSNCYGLIGVKYYEKLINILHNFEFFEITQPQFLYRPQNSNRALTINIVLYAFNQNQQKRNLELLHIQLFTRLIFWQDWLFYKSYSQKFSKSLMQKRKSSEVSKSLTAVFSRFPESCIQFNMVAILSGYITVKILGKSENEIEFLVYNEEIRKCLVRLILLCDKLFKQCS